jgi:hypothetical protein
MRAANLSSRIERALQTYAEAGGCLDYFAFDLDDSDAQLEPLVLHRNAVQVVMSSIELEQSAHLEQLWAKDLISQENKERARFKFDLAEAHPRPVSVEEFLGSHFDLVAKKLIVRGARKSNLNRYFLAGLEESKAFERFPRHGGEFSCDGYAACFAEPPHGVGTTGSVLEEWFNLINAELFGGLIDGLEILLWSNDWSSYFDDGKEWWGAYLWSIHNPINKRLAVIGASTTD